MVRGVTAQCSLPGEVGGEQSAAAPFRGAGLAVQPPVRSSPDKRCSVSCRAMVGSAAPPWFAGPPGSHEWCGAVTNVRRGGSAETAPSPRLLDTACDGPPAADRWVLLRHAARQPSGLAFL